MVIAPFWFSTGYRWTALTCFWLSADDTEKIPSVPAKGGRQQQNATKWKIHFKSWSTIKISKTQILQNDIRKLTVSACLLYMRDIKHIYHSFVWVTGRIYGPSTTSTVLFSAWLRPSENRTIEQTSEPIDSTRASAEWCIQWTLVITSTDITNFHYNKVIWAVPNFRFPLYGIIFVTLI